MRIHTVQHNDTQKNIKLQQVVADFESLFLQKLFDTMQNNIPKSPLLHSREESLWQGMLNEEYAKNFAHAGGVGLSTMLYNALSKNG